jgi:ABC-type antimicrobial peptide transport system permease subunit
LASTWGGFLVGVGLSLLLVTLSVLFVIENYYVPMYREIMDLKPQIESLYSITHHTLYGFAIDALRAIAGVVGWIPIPWLRGAADKLRNAANIMENARSGSERAYDIVKTAEVFPPERLYTYILAAFVFSIILISTGSYLIIKAKRYKPIEKPSA